MTRLAFDRQALKRGLRQALRTHTEWTTPRGSLMVSGCIDLDALVDRLIEELKPPRLVGEESERREGGVPDLEKDD